MSPRPILKRSPAPSHRSRNAVHFPPSPSLTTHTFAVYSATAYDRSPIVVAPNGCALPERGCPGRTYTLEEEASSIPDIQKRHLHATRERHPRALISREDTPRRTYPPLPPLIPDLSSESDESDSFLYTPLETSSAHHIHGLAIPQAKYQTLECASYAHGSISPPSALSFLPHPPSSPSRASYDHGLSYDDHHLAKYKPRRERKNDSSRTPDRIPIETGDLPVIATPTKSRRSRIAGLSKCLSAAQSSFRVEDDGCLGGF